MNIDHHPCFSKEARHRFGRIHLPVAPKCNMQCNYCNRDFECVNESRPGVAGAVLLPRQAAAYLDTVLTKIGNIAVVGIAGPGDPFANGEATMETLRLVRERHPEMLLCLATNGLGLTPYYIDELALLKISHVTLTVNAVDPEIGQKIYAWARVNQHMYRGLDAARIILERQLEGIRRLKEKGIVVKINTVVIPGVNDGHVAAIARTVSMLKADIMNCIPMVHVAGTPFAGIAPPMEETMRTLRGEISLYMPQMAHCHRCRADAAGLLGEGQDAEIQALLKRAAATTATAERPYVAVASREGIFVNQHLGEAASLWIFGLQGGKADLVERRSTPPAGGGSQRWAAMAELMSDCSAVLTSGIGAAPQQMMEAAQIRVVVMEGMATEGVETILSGREVPKILRKTPGICGLGKSCRGNGMGCG
ncbi:MAG: radical SAM protein [Deltaproteobacteria bacterium]|nr:radical SAM protein [Deltaproteobacteria bacterium]